MLNAHCHFSRRLTIYSLFLLFSLLFLKKLRISLLRLLECLLERSGDRGILELSGQGLVGLFAVRKVASLPEKSAIAAAVELELHPREDEMVSANFEGLVPPHDDVVAAVLLVLKDLDGASTTLLPFLALLVETVKDRLVSKQLLLILVDILIRGG